MSAVDTSGSLTTTKSTSMTRDLSIEVPSTQSLDFTGDDLEEPIAPPLATQPSARDSSPEHASEVLCICKRLLIAWQYIYQCFDVSTQSKTVEEKDTSASGDSSAQPTTEVQFVQSSAY